MENTRGLEVKKEMRRNGNVSELGKTLNIILNTKWKIANINNIDEKINVGNNKSRRNIIMSFVAKSKDLDVRIESNGSFSVIAEVNTNENR